MQRQVDLALARNRLPRNPSLLASSREGKDCAQGPSSRCSTSKIETSTQPILRPSTLTTPCRVPHSLHTSSSDHGSSGG
jgi:hypothetical protein